MDASKQEQLIAEYNANVELWKHDDNLRQKRNGNFLNVNTILFVGLGAISSLENVINSFVPLVIFISIFGILICVVWNSVQVRNAEYVRFSRYQLRQIEAELNHMTTFTNIFQAFYKYRAIKYQKIDEQFEINSQAKKRSTLSEGNLPKVIGILWGLILSITSVIAISIEYS